MPALLSEDEWDDLETRADYDVQAALAAARRQPEPDVNSVTDAVWHDAADPAQVGGMAAEGIVLPAGDFRPKPTKPTRINIELALLSIG